MSSHILGILLGATLAGLTALGVRSVRRHGRAPKGTDFDWAVVPLLLLAIVAMFVINGAHLNSCEPYGGYDGDAFLKGAGRLWWTFSPLLGVFLWIAVLGLTYAFTRRTSSVHVIMGLSVSFPLLWLTFCLVLPVDTLGYLSPVVCTAAGVLAVSLLLGKRKWALCIVPLAINLLWSLTLMWYGRELMAHFGD